MGSHPHHTKLSQEQAQDPRVGPRNPPSLQKLRIFVRLGVEKTDGDWEPEAEDGEAEH